MKSVVSVDRVSFVDELGRAVLDGVSLHVQAGESIAIVGHNGGGKTTLLRLLAGLFAPTSGTIEVLGLDVAKASYREMARHRTRVGFVFELAGLWANRTIEENVALPLRYHGHALDPAAIQRKVRDLAGELGIERELAIPSFRANASVRKRALVARALALEPEVLLCDEPQVGLVRKEAELVAAAMERRRSERGLGVVIADHDGYLDPYVVDRSVFLENGRLLNRPSAAPPQDRQSDPESSPASVTAGFGGAP